MWCDTVWLKGALVLFLWIKTSDPSSNINLINNTWIQTLFYFFFLYIYCFVTCVFFYFIIFFICFPMWGNIYMNPNSKPKYSLFIIKLQWNYLPPHRQTDRQTDNRTIQLISLLEVIEVKHHQTFIIQTTNSHQYRLTKQINSSHLFFFISLFFSSF